MEANNHIMEANNHIMEANNHNMEANNHIMEANIHIKSLQGLRRGRSHNTSGILLCVGW
jgi:hypothetical protein